ncbi:DNA-formamidopyrimidine glycosylase [Mobiluncus mulieris FB024-16]|nr:DNA-formamidopyrimidine glycosylase [Mobiluncus mulieris FB024-16]
MGILMPELPEVETIRRNLSSHLLNTCVTAVSAPTHPRSLRFQPGGFSRFHELLVGKRLESVSRRGKFLWLELSGNQTAWCFHLGMSGQLRLAAGDITALPHERLRFTLDNGLELVFCDQRTFGHTEVRALEPTTDGAPGGMGTEQALLPAGLGHIARDVLDPNLDVSWVVSRLRSSRRAIKTKLLDQATVSGIGNIYADETLFAAGVHPATLARNLSGEDLRNLLEVAASVMRHALEFGGTSFDQLYVDSWGNPGDFASELLVYGRGGQACHQCGQALDKIVLDGRATVFCAHCTPAHHPAVRKAD